MCGESLRQGKKEVKGSRGKCSHVGEAVGLACFQRDRLLTRAGGRETRVSGWIPVPVARRSGGARLGKTPRGGKTLAHRAGEEHGIGLGRRPDTCERNFREIQEHGSRRVGIDDRSAEEVGGRAWGCASRAADMSPPADDSASATV